MSSLIDSSNLFSCQRSPCLSPYKLFGGTKSIDKLKLGWVFLGRWFTYTYLHRPYIELLDVSLVEIPCASLDQRFLSSCLNRPFGPEASKGARGNCEVDVHD